MKVFAILAAVFAMALSVNAEQEASVHLRVSTNGDDICYLSCDEGMHCPKGTNKCRSPPKGSCWNVMTAEFVESCDVGFYCEKNSNSCQLGNKDYAAYLDKKAHKDNSSHEDGSSNKDSDSYKESDSHKDKNDHETKEDHKDKDDHKDDQKDSKDNEDHRNSDDSSSKKCMNASSGKYVLECPLGFKCKSGVCDYI